MTYLDLNVVVIVVKGLQFGSGKLFILTAYDIYVHIKLYKYRDYIMWIDEIIYKSIRPKLTNSVN